MSLAIFAAVCVFAWVVLAASLATESGNPIGSVLVSAIVVMSIASVLLSFDATDTVKQLEALIR